MMKRKLQYLILLLTFLPFVNVNAQVAPPNAGFAYDTGIDTVWIRSPYVFVNTSTYDVRNYWRIVPVTGAFNALNPNNKCNEFGCFIDTTSRSFRYKFENVGTYLITLVSRNNLGVDSVTKLIYVGLATKKPKANFYIDKYVIGNAEKIPLYDLSQNGPTEWFWYMTPACYICNDPNQANNSFDPDAYAQLPKFFAQEGGKYGICLVAKNDMGSDTLCRPNYVEVIAGTSINAGQAGGLDTLIKAPEGYLYDNGGPNVNYFNRIPNVNEDFLNGKFFIISPCASKITLQIEQFKFRNNDSLLIHTGSKTGPIIARLGGSNIPASLRRIEANTDRLVIEWKCGPGEQGALDSGFVIKYSSIPANYGPPVAKFSSPDVVYSGYNIKYTNESTGSGNLTYAWDVDGLDSDVDPFNNTGFEFDTRDGANYTFYNTTMGEYYRNVCLLVSNCKATSRFCKQITVRPIVTGPAADFSSPRPAGFTTDVFKLIDETKNGALTWKWTITPNNVTYVQGTSSTSQNPIFRLNSRGRYNVKLLVSNVITTVYPDLTTSDSIAYDSIEKTFFLDVISYSSPNTEWPIASGNDIGISRVRILGTDLDTTTNLKTPVYDTIFAKKTVVMYRGKNYPIEISRTTSVNGMDRKVWVDTSLDGLFIAPGELIYSEINKNTLTATANFQLPNNIEVGRILRMRVGISEANSTLSADKATSGCFEDYGIEVGLNNEVPTIELNGDSVFQIQLRNTFNDPGVIANDDIEGDISSRYESITNLDTTKVGFYYKKYFVKDLYGNVSDTVYRTIQVEINQQGPKLSLNAPDSIFVNVRKDTLSKLLAKPTALDYLGDPMNPSLISRYGSVDSSIIGDYVLTWTIKDEFNKRDTVRQRIYVRDIEAPRGEIPDSVTRIVKHQIGEGFDLRKVLILGDNYYSIDELTITRTGSVNENKEGTQTISYVVCDPSGNCSAPSFILVDVRDIIPPVVTLKGENPWIVDVFMERDKFEAADAVPEASDNYYQDLTKIYNYNNVNLNVIGTYVITYTVRDGAGNETKVTRDVNVVDRKAPKIDLLGGLTVELIWMDTFKDPGVKIIDNYDSESYLLSVLDTSTTLEVYNGKWFGGKRGYKEVRYNVTDSSGNVATEVIRRVVVDFKSGLADLKTNGELSVYPNPNNGIFTIKTKEALKGSTTATLYNVLGAKVYSETYEANGVSTHEVTTSKLKNGVYMLHVFNNGKQFTQRVVIE